MLHEADFLDQVLPPPPAFLSVEVFWEEYLAMAKLKVCRFSPKQSHPHNPPLLPVCGLVISGLGGMKGNRGDIMEV